MQKQQHSFTVFIEKDEDIGVFVGQVPGLPGCHSQGKTIDELLKNMKEVIALCLEVEPEKTHTIPKFVGVQQVEITS